MEKATVFPAAFMLNTLIIGKIIRTFATVIASQSVLPCIIRRGAITPGAVTCPAVSIAIPTKRYATEYAVRIRTIATIVPRRRTVTGRATAHIARGYVTHK